MRNKNNIYVKIEHDPDTESPFEWETEWEFLDFINNYSTSFPKFESLEPDQCGSTWFFLDCYRHGSHVWGLHNEVSTCQWDTSRKCGVLNLVNGDPANVGGDAVKSARSILEEYNKWFEGDTWWYRVSYDKQELKEGVCPCCETPDANWSETYEEEIDSVGGFLGSEYMLEEIFRVLKSDIIQKSKTTRYNLVCDVPEHLKTEIENKFNKIYEHLGDEHATRPKALS